MTRFVPFLLLSAAFSVSTVSAAEKAAESAPPAPRPAAVPERTDLDQGAIFRILCGGVTQADAGLSQHLWTVAGSLADGQWTPPKVTIRVVVSDPADR